jgi:MFS family permease
MASRRQMLLGDAGYTEDDSVLGLAAPLDSRRFVALAQFCTANMLVALQWMTYASIVHEVKDFFAVTAFQVDLLAISYELVYVALLPATLYVFERFSFKLNMAVATHMCLLGSVIKMASVLWYPSFALLMAAQLLFAVACAIILTAPPVLTALWFGAAERTLATAAGAMSNNFGIAVGMMLPPLLVTPKNHGRDAFAVLFAIQLGIALVSSLVHIFAVPAAPARPPTAVAQLHGTHGPRSWKNVANSTLDVLSNGAFVLLLCGMSLLLAVVWTVSGVLPQLLRPYSVSERLVGLMGFVGIVAGMLIALGVAYLVDRSKNYKFSMVASGALAAAAAVGVAIAMGTLGDAALLPAVFALIVLFNVAQCCAIPIAFEFAVELTFPVDEAISATLLMWGGNVLGAALYFAMPALLGDNPSTGAALTTVAIFAAAAVGGALLFGATRSELRRTKFGDNEETSADIYAPPAF